MSILRRWMIPLVALLSISASCATLDTSNAQAPVPVLYEGNGQYHLAPRLALVIGVASLADAAGFLSLKNPKHDADKVASALRAVGFSVVNLDEVYRPEELTRQNIKKALYDFAITLQSTGGVGLIYFSGHGLERNGQIYVAPYDAYVQFERDFNEELIAIGLFYDAFAFAKNPLNILVLDACRDNPWTKPLNQFGGNTASIASQASKDVVVANSTLSGGKALDGSDELSPYAQAFVEALQLPDQGLSQFFSTIGDTILQLQNDQPAIQTPVLLQPGGHEFVFLSTTETFNREQSIYSTGVTQGNRLLLQKLTSKYAAGYFYKAAKYWLDHAPLAPTPDAPTKAVILQNAAPLRDSPATEGRVLETRPAGTHLAINESTFVKTGWLGVNTDWSDAPAWVVSDSAQIAPLSVETTIVKVTFQKGASAGIEALTAESEQSIQMLKSYYTPTVTRIEIAGFHYSGTKLIARSNLRLLAREAAVVQALSDVGFKTPSISLTERASDNPGDEDALQLEVKGATLKPSPGSATGARK
jgi:Caspase domain